MKVFQQDLYGQAKAKGTRLRERLERL
jgi:hypothetical protein